MRFKHIQILTTDPFCVLNVSTNKLESKLSVTHFKWRCSLILKTVLHLENMSPVFNMFLVSVTVFTPGFLIKLFTGNFTRLCSDVLSTV